jgi:hypothetical protein
VDIRTPKHWNLKGYSVTSPFVLSVSNILSPLSSHCVFIPGMEKLGARFKNIFAISYPLKIA